MFYTLRRNNDLWINVTQKYHFMLLLLLLVYFHVIRMIFHLLRITTLTITIQKTLARTGTLWCWYSEYSSHLFGWCKWYSSSKSFEIVCALLHASKTTFTSTHGEDSELSLDNVNLNHWCIGYFWMWKFQDKFVRTTMHKLLYINEACICLF